MEFQKLIESRRSVRKYTAEGRPTREHRYPIYKWYLKM